MLAGFHRFGRHPHVQRYRCENRDCVQFRMFEELAKILVLRGWAIGLHHMLQPVVAQVAYRRNLAIGIEMPLKLRTEVPAHDSDPDNTVTGWTGKDSPRLRDSRGSQCNGY